MHQQLEWGPQPETLKEFRIITSFANGDGIEVMHIRDNYRRLIDRTVNLDQVLKLRLEVLGTNGLDHARIFEIKCY
ncbi:hypothetical protein JCM10914_3695 [Paenibacillus sp. JCM 10914]|nr:hypothetical protein JCM10914_3695 [Paenibacillus sp. JCM 10914]